MRTLISLLRPHNQEIDEKYHQLTFYNIMSSASFFSFLQMIENVEGDIVECGVGRSRSLAIWCALVAGLGLNRKIIAYDSFAGFPTPTEEDTSARNPKRGEWSSSPSGKYEYTEEFSKMILREAELPLEDIDLTLVKGFFSDTLPQNKSNKIALLNIDGDLYQSYKACLENLYDKVSPGGLILFDDFDEEDQNQNFPGARQAVKEFFGKSDYSKIKQNRFGVYYYLKE